MKKLGYFVLLIWTSAWIAYGFNPHPANIFGLWLFVTGGSIGAVLDFSIVEFINWLDRPPVPPHR